MTVSAARSSSEMDILGLLDRLPAFGIGDELGAGAHHVLAGVDDGELQPRILQVADVDAVAAGARVEAVLRPVPVIEPLPRPPWLVTLTGPPPAW